MWRFACRRRPTCGCDDAHAPTSPRAGALPREPGAGVRPTHPNDTAAVTVNMSADEKTAEMPVANDDDTTEMEIEGGTINTKQG